MKKIISVIIPVYNKERYLLTILNQLKNQSLKDFECILVEDGSIDNSGKICDEFAESDSRFRVYHIPNDGVSHARNVALEHAEGKYITFVDADDEIHADYLMNLYQCMVDSGAEIVISGLQKFWDHKEERKNVRYPKAGQLLKKAEVLQDFAEVQQATGIFGFCTCKIFEKETMAGLRFDETLCLAEDFEFYLRLYAKIETFYFDDKCYYYYRQAAAASSAIVEDSAVDYLAQLKINLKYRDFLQKEGAYIGTNRSIVEEKINNYAYFTMFHCPKECMEERFEELYDICRESSVVLTGQGLRQKILLNLLQHKKFSAAEKWILMYRLLRSLKNGSRK